MTRQPTPRGRVLVIEDYYAVSEVEAQLLTMEGYEVRVATTGAEGLELIRTFAPDLVVLDLMLPDRGGLEVLDDARRAAPTLPVVVVSAALMITDDTHWRDDPNILFVSKPFRLAVLADAVATLLRRRDLDLRSA